MINMTKTFYEKSLHIYFEKG